MRLVSPRVGLIPTTELNDDGQSMEPSVSVSTWPVLRFRGPGARLESRLLTIIFKISNMNLCVTNSTERHTYLVLNWNRLSVYTNINRTAIENVPGRIIQTLTVDLVIKYK